jgi:Fe-S-cluster containining protein
MMPSDFAAFHRHFNGTTWEACAACGGICESDTIAALLPGEAEYIAKSLGMSVKVFKQRYMDGVETSRGIIDVIRLNKVCPFIDAEKHCTLGAAKAVMCEVYPLSVTLVDDKIRLSLDERCPMHDNVTTVLNFGILGKEYIRRYLHPEMWWYVAVAEFDDYYDFDACNRLRSKPGYKIFTLDELRHCRATHGGEVNADR